MSIKIKLVVLLLLSVVQIDCKNQGDSTNQVNKIEIIDPATFKEKSIDQTIIDIRTPGEYNQGYIEGAININYFDKDFLNKISELDKTKPVFIYCRSGNRTSSASKKIANLGFEKVYDLQGGILNWSKKNNKIAH